MTDTPIPAEARAPGSWHRAWSVMTEPFVATAAAWIASVAVPVAVAGALVPVRGEVPNTTMALGLAVFVTLLAAVGTRATAAVAALSSGLSFDIFLTRPYNSLAINRAADLETTALLLAVGLVAGQLAARTRHHRLRADEASYDLGRIHAVAEMVALGEPTDQVVIAVANELTDLLGLRSCRFEETFAEGPTPFVERQGSITWGALRWGFRTMGLPSHEITLVVQHQGLPLGRYVLTPTPGRRVTVDELLAAVALADQAGAALAAQRRPI
jgi:K+-sensing histidine kinase KdpD